MSVEMLCVGCGQPTAVHDAAVDLYQTKRCVLYCEKCQLASQVSFDRWQEGRMGSPPDDFDLEQIDDAYAAEMAKRRLVVTPYKEGK